MKFRQKSEGGGKVGREVGEQCKIGLTGFLFLKELKLIPQVASSVQLQQLGRVLRP